MKEQSKVRVGTIGFVTARGKRQIPRQTAICAWDVKNCETLLDIPGAMC